MIQWINQEYHYKRNRHHWLKFITVRRVTLRAIDNKSHYRNQASTRLWVINHKTKIFHRPVIFTPGCGDNPLFYECDKARTMFRMRLLSELRIILIIGSTSTNWLIPLAPKINFPLLVYDHKNFGVCTWVWVIPRYASDTARHACPPITL